MGSLATSFVADYSQLISSEPVTFDYRHCRTALSTLPVTSPSDPRGRLQALARLLDQSRQSLLIDLQYHSGIPVSDLTHLVLRGRPQQLCGL